jgi:hypothetical protein
MAPAFSEVDEHSAQKGIEVVLNLADKNGFYEYVLTQFRR